MVQAEPGPAPSFADAVQVAPETLCRPTRPCGTRSGGEGKQTTQPGRRTINSTRRPCPLRLFSSRAESQIRIKPIHSFPRLLASSSGNDLSRSPLAILVLSPRVHQPRNLCAPGPRPSSQDMSLLAAPRSILFVKILAGVYQTTRLFVYPSFQFHAFNLSITLPS